MCRFGVAMLASLMLTGCQAPYLVRSAWSQADLLMSRQSLDKVLSKDEVAEDERKKLVLAREAKEFGERALGLKKTSNYDSYVKLERPYVSYVVSAAETTRLESHLWKFPLVGSLPYKGFFNPEDAKSEAEDLKKEGLDTYVRGVSAYSTLGWFDDPILSSMLRYSDYDLVNTIIHESVHATLYIKSQADFNERLATYIGNIGADLFFREKEGAASPTIAEAKRDGDDEALFSKFISSEVDQLKAWYENQGLSPEQQEKPSAEFLKKRSDRLAEIAARYQKELRPKIKSERYAKFLDRELSAETLNNARLLAWKLYVYDLSDFDRLYDKLGRDPKKLIEFAKSLEKEDDPEAKLKQSY